VAKRYGKGTIELKGFDEFIQNLQDAGGKIDREGKACFEKCAKETEAQLIAKAKSAGLDPKLLRELKSETIQNNSAGVWYFETGWKKGKPDANKISDAYKVLFYNYGTPKRTTKKGQNRGKEKTTNFIANAKRAAARKCKKVQKDFLQDITKGL
jgi:hypothetical protein